MKNLYSIPYLFLINRQLRSYYEYDFEIKKVYMIVIILSTIFLSQRLHIFLSLNRYCKRIHRHQRSLHVLSYLTWGDLIFHLFVVSFMCEDTLLYFISYQQSSLLYRRSLMYTSSLYSFSFGYTSNFSNSSIVLHLCLLLHEESTIIPNYT